MSLSKEYSIYCLSKKNGWIHTKSRHDFGKEEIINKNPDDVILEIKFLTEMTNPFQVNKSEHVVFQTKDLEELKKTQEVHGKRPNNPYI